MLKAYAKVDTEKAERYLKALCNHFNRKVEAEYTDTHGSVQFGFGTCEINAEAGALAFHIQADDEANFERVKYVIADHLTRFSGDEALHVQWSNNQS